MRMKKVFYVLAALLAVAIACEKEKPEPTPDDNPQEKPEEKPDDPKEEAATLTLVSDAIVDLAAESGISVVKFTTNKDWTAEVTNAPEGAVVLSSAKGEKGENIELKVTYQNLPEEELGRIFNLTLKAGDKTAKVDFFQGLVFFLPDEETTVGVDGGKVEYTVLTNLEYTIKKYDGADEAFPFAPVTITEGDHFVKVLFDIEANGDYDYRYSYVKFTLPAIQMDVLDDEGNPTGETEDDTEYLYVFQEGYAQTLWSVGLPADFDVTNSDEPIHDATASIAYFNGKILVSDATKIYQVDPATGAFSPFNVPEGLPVQSIANDDAGNLLLANLAGYCEIYDVYAVKATDTALANPVKLIHFVNEAWSGSRGIDKVAARGDVFGNGVVSSIYGGVISYGGLSYTLYWNIWDGKAPESYYNEWNPVVNNPGSGWFTTPDLGDDLWLSNRAVFVPAGPSASDGLFYAGYDGLYSIYYYDGVDWIASVPDVGNWAYAPNSLATIDWNGRKILACVNMAYFPEWGMPSALLVLDVTDPKNPEWLSAGEYDGPHEVTGGQESATTGVVLNVEGDDLYATVVDSSWGVLRRVKFPKL